MKYRATAYGILGQVLAVKVFTVSPKFSELNRFSNRVALKYGAHPKVKVEVI